MNPEHIAIGRRIRDMREYQRLSREKLAELSNISTQFLADIETGKKGMTVVTLKKICTALHTTADSLVFAENEGSVSLLGAMLATLPPEKQVQMEEIVQKIIIISCNRTPSGD